MQVLSYNEAAAKAGVVRRTLERLISLGEGPAVIEISPRRRGIMDSDLEQSLYARRRAPPGAVRLSNSAEAPASLIDGALKSGEGRPA
jgi:hypothetical protein